MSQPLKGLHVDEFVDGEFEPWLDIGDEKHARWFFFLRRLPAHLFYEFADYTKPVQLYCTCMGERWRVTGASRLGDVWLTRNMAQEDGYQRRVLVNDCTHFSKTNNVTELVERMTV